MTIKPGEDFSCNQNDNLINEDGQNTEQNESVKNTQQQVELQEDKIDEEEKDAKSQQESELKKESSEQTKNQEIELLRKLAEDKQKEIDEYKNRWIRTQADFDNYRKRIQREIQEINLYAGEQLIKDILPVIDNFERALNSAKGSDDAFYKGVQMIYQQLIDILKKHEVKEIEAVGKPFNPNFHEAVMTSESEDLEPDTVAEVLLKGYMYHSKVIRPSMVKVVKN